MTGCVHCGTELGSDEFICPSCRKVQPPAGAGKDWYRSEEFQVGGPEGPRLPPLTHLGFGIGTFVVALALLALPYAPELRAGFRLGPSLLLVVVAVPWLRGLRDLADAEVSEERERVLHAAMLFVGLTALVAVASFARALTRVMA